MVIRVYSLEMAIHRKNSDISKVVADFRHLQTRLPHFHIVGYNSKKLLDATENYFIAALDLFGELITQRTDHTFTLNFSHYIYPEQQKITATKKNSQIDLRINVI